MVPTLVCTFYHNDPSNGGLAGPHASGKCVGVSQYKYFNSLRGINAIGTNDIGIPGSRRRCVKEVLKSGYQCDV